MPYFSKSHLVTLVTRLSAVLEYWIPARPVSPLPEKEIEELERKGRIW